MASTRLVGNMMRIKFIKHILSTMSLYNIIYNKNLVITSQTIMMISTDDRSPLGGDCFSSPSISPQPAAEEEQKVTLDPASVESILCTTVLHCTVLYCTVLCCAILYYRVYPLHTAAPRVHGGQRTRGQDLAGLSVPHLRTHAHLRRFPR